MEKSGKITNQFVVVFICCCQRMMIKENKNKLIQKNKNKNKTPRQMLIGRN